MDRRDFIKTSILGAGGIILIPACASQVSPYIFFSREEAHCLIALCEQIIPADNNGPGATNAGVINYIDRQLYEVFKWEQRIYKNGLEAIQNSSKKIFNRKFENLDFNVQTDFVVKMESDTLPREYWKKTDSSEFLNLVIEHTKQGFYGSPRHGGNKDYISYRMLNFDYPQVVGQNRYRGKNVK